MEAFLTGIQTSVTSLMGMIASVTTSLLSNELFQLGLALLVVTIMIGIVKGLVKVRGGRRRR